MQKESPSKTNVVAEPAPIKQVLSKLERAESLVRKNVYITATVGIIPIPLFDLLALSGLQLNMLYQLSKIYDIPFSKEAARSVIGSLIGGGGSTVLAQPASYSIAKVVPFIGTTIGSLAMPVLGGAATYALGKVFIQHFESGGTFLTFDPKEVKEYFVHLQQEGKLVVAEVLGTK